MWFAEAGWRASDDLLTGVPDILKECGDLDDLLPGRRAGKLMTLISGACSTVCDDAVLQTAGHARPK